MNAKLQVTSEVGRLKRVILKRPSRELENLTPKYLQDLLFDDIPFLDIMQKEHDAFTDLLRSKEVEVLYLEQLLAEALQEKAVRETFLDTFLIESEQVGAEAAELKTYLNGQDPQMMIEKITAGVRREEVPGRKKQLSDMLTDPYPFLLNPMPNLYFTRDFAAVVGKGITINKMHQPARRRESVFMEYIMRYHPEIQKEQIPIWLNRHNSFSIEGGDELVLSEKVMAIGISERTDARAIENLASRLLRGHSGFEKILAVEIPTTRAFMHLDTVFTMVSVNQFVIHPGLIKNKQLHIYEIELTNDGEDLQIERHDDFKAVLKRVLDQPEIDFIFCGNGEEIDAAREQWNDGANTLAIAPGEVITYDRNLLSNKVLRAHGIVVNEIPSSELSRGRGGPRCMTLPILRDPV